MHASPHVSTCVGPFTSCPTAWPRCAILPRQEDVHDYVNPGRHARLYTRHNESWIRSCRLVFREDIFSTLVAETWKAYVRPLWFSTTRRDDEHVCQGGEETRGKRCCEKGQRTFCRWCINSVDFACTVSWTRGNWGKKGRTGLARFFFVRHYVTVAWLGVALLVNLSRLLFHCICFFRENHFARTWDFSLFITWISICVNFSSLEQVPL